MRICNPLYMGVIALLISACATVIPGGPIHEPICQIAVGSTVLEVDRLEGEGAVLVDDCGDEWAVPSKPRRLTPGMVLVHGKRDRARERRARFEVHQLMESFRRVARERR